jgi:hypothetical protein
MILTIDDDNINNNISINNNINTVNRLMCLCTLARSSSGSVVVTKIGLVIITDSTEPLGCSGDSLNINVADIDVDVDVVVVDDVSDLLTQKLIPIKGSQP